MLLVEPCEVFLDHNLVVQCELVAAARSSFPLLQGLFQAFLTQEMLLPSVGLYSEQKYGSCQTIRTAVPCLVS